jgi:hypothetical protein
MSRRILAKLEQKASRSKPTAVQALGVSSRQVEIALLACRQELDSASERAGDNRGYASSGSADGRS